MTVDEKRAFAAPLREQGIDYPMLSEAPMCGLCEIETQHA